LLFITYSLQATISSRRLAHSIDTILRAITENTIITIIDCFTGTSPALVGGLITVLGSFTGMFCHTMTLTLATEEARSLTPTMIHQSQAIVTTGAFVLCDQAFL
jgi:hypothetical protein